MIRLVTDREEILYRSGWELTKLADEAVRRLGRVRAPERAVRFACRVPSADGKNGFFRHGCPRLDPRSFTERRFRPA
jgi:hypothetical protein